MSNTKTTTVQIADKKGRMGYGCADVVAGESIRLYGVRYPGTAHAAAYDRTFRIGDVAEHHSYNLSYTGIITSITAKTVTIVEKNGRGTDRDETRRLSLYEFEWRNWNFDAEATARDNAATMMTI